ncbi:MAG TPA: alpha/beta hydrolase [Acidimicrobiales bacterium]|nr:alpha/beta hydrolase [Acidimicrobiales bacterium]
MPGFSPHRRRAILLTAALAVATSCTSSHHTTAATTTTGPTGTATTVTAPAPTAPATTAVPLPAVAPVSWKPCTGIDGPSGYDCAGLAVPLDYTNPAGPKITVALDRKRAAGAKIGSLIMNPGGPGASGVDALDYISSLFPQSVLDHFDIVGFDPRGVGRSSPVRCETGPQLDQFIHLNPAPTTAAGFQTLLAGAKTFAQNCQAKSGAVLPFVGTVNAARDMDEIRAAVGDAKLNYIGFSYGTFLGATYAELFPTHIRVMVLDGALDPALGPIATNIEQAAGFDGELNAFFAFCAGSASCPWKPGGDMRAAYESIMANIGAHPLPTGTTRTLGPGEAFFGVAQELYDQAAWPGLASALAAAQAGDGSQLLQYSDEYTQRGPNGVYSNSLEANNAISCVDQPWPRDPAVLQQSAALAKQRAPEFGIADLYGALPCTGWPAPPTSQPHAIAAAGSPPIVVVGSTGDPATPYADAQGLAKELKSGVLLTRVGDGHTGYRSSICVRNYVDTYLLQLTVPSAGTRCPTP